MTEDLKIIKKKYGEDMMHLCRDLFPTLLEKRGLLSQILLNNFHESHYLCQDIVANNLEYDFKNFVYSFVDVENNFVMRSDKTDDQDIIVIIHDDKKIYLKRLYGWFMISLDDFKKVELKVGTIIAASINKGARKPAYKMRIDFGDAGIKNTSAQITKLYEPSDLIGKQVVAVINFPPLKVSEVKSEVLVLGAETPDGVVLLTTDKLVANGAMVD